MLKRLSGLFLTGLLLISTWSVIAQNENTSSPYSRFGLGDIHPYSYGRFAAMGGASIGSRHQVQINTSNPASYSAVDSLTFIFEFGADGRLSDFKAGDKKYQTNDDNFRDFAFNFPITKWAGATMGVLPFADKGYEVFYEETLPNGNNAGYSYNGTGSISKAFFGAGFDITDKLSLGVNVYYLFGIQNTNSSIAFQDANSYSYTSIERARLRDFSYQLGLQYDIPLKDHKFLTIGATLENKRKFTAFHDLLKRNILQTANGVLADTLQIKENEKGKIELPSTFSLGVSLAKLNKYEINADYYYANWSQAKLFNSVEEYTNQSRFSLGGEYIPELATIRSYFKKIRYRAGLHYEKSYLKVNGKQINEFGMSFGLGLPLNRSKSTINLAVELGKRGTTANSLVRENYTKLSMYLNLHDKWFFKRKFD